MFKRKREDSRASFSKMVHIRGLFEFIYSFLLHSIDKPYNSDFQADNMVTFWISKNAFRNLYFKLIPFIMPSFTSQNNITHWKDSTNLTNLYALQCEIPLDFSLFSASLKKLRVGSHCFDGMCHETKRQIIHSVENWNCPYLEDLDCHFSQDGINSLGRYFPGLIKLKLLVDADNIYIQNFSHLTNLYIGTDKSENNNLFIGHMRKLESLSLSMDLASLHLSHIPNLREILAPAGLLEIHEQIQLIGEFPLLCKIKIGFTRISKLNINNSILRQLTTFQGGVLDSGSCYVMKEMQNLKKLHIDRIDICESFPLSVHLEKIYWYDCNTRFWSRLLHLDKLKELHLDCNCKNFTQIEWNYLEAISNLPKLNVLSIDGETGNPSKIVSLCKQEFTKQN